MGKSKNQGNTGQKDLWEIRVSKSETAMAEQNFEEVITSSTWALNKLLENHVLRLLELRATAYEKKGLLSRALEDATKMIQYVPTSPTGYLTTGNILMTHGKPSVAVDNYKKGLRTVPNFHHQYKRIQKECAIATARTQQRFDIVARLPRELVYKVLTNLDPERVWVCLNVSTEWCEQISRCGTWWSTVVVKQTGTEIDQAVCDAIPLVKDYIQQLELANLSSTGLNKKYLAHLKYGVFTKIKALSLKGAFFKAILSEDLAIALWQVRGTLTSLKVDFESGKSFPLLMILGSCPDITELCYTTTETMELWNGGDDYGSGCKKLSNLELYCGSTSYLTLCRHLAVCPNLCRLILKFFNAQPFGDWSCGTFTDYCPKVRILGLNYAERLPDVDDYADLADEKGVAFMGVMLDDYCSSPYQSVTHISAQSHSLRHLNITHKKSRTDEYYTLSTTRVTYDRLHTLRYTRYDDIGIYYYDYNYTISVQNYVGMIIQNSPVLADLSLYGGPYISTHIRTPLEQVVKAKTMSLTLHSVSFESTNVTWYSSFFSSLSCIHTLVLRKISLGEDKLSSLAASESIQQLSIIECTDITNGLLAEFFKRVALKRTHNLNTLNITSIPASMDDTAVRFLVKIRGLKTLRITDCKRLNVDSINHLIACAPASPLKTIEILDCFPKDVAVSWSDSVDRLKKKGIALLIE